MVLGRARSLCSDPCQQASPAGECRQAGAASAQAPHPGPPAQALTSSTLCAHRPLPLAASRPPVRVRWALPSPSGSTAWKCTLLSSTASWKCSAVFATIQRCISLALILRSAFTSTLQAKARRQTRPLEPGTGQTDGRTKGWPAGLHRHEQGHALPDSDAGAVRGQRGWLGRLTACWAGQPGTTSPQSGGRGGAQTRPSPLLTTGSAVNPNPHAQTLEQDQTCRQSTVPFRTWAQTVGGEANGDGSVCTRESAVPTDAAAHTRVQTSTHVPDLTRLPTHTFGCTPVIQPRPPGGPLAGTPVPQVWLRHAVLQELRSSSESPSWSRTPWILGPGT